MTTAAASAAACQLPVPKNIPNIMFARARVQTKQRTTAPAPKGFVETRAKANVSHILASAANA